MPGQANALIPPTQAIGQSTSTEEPTRSGAPSGAVVVPLQSYTAIPDQVRVHFRLWRSRGWHQHVAVFEAACKAAGLGRSVNAERLREIAVEFGLDPLGSLRRVQLVLRDLCEWGFLRWESEAKLRQYHRSRLLVAGRHFAFEITSFAYLEERAQRTRATKAQERAEAVAKRQQKQTTLPAVERPAQRLDKPTGDWRSTWEDHQAALRELWQPIAPAELQQLQAIWCHCAAYFERKGFAYNAASKYLRWLARSSGEREGARYPLLVARVPERMASWLGRNRESLKCLET